MKKLLLLFIVAFAACTYDCGQGEFSLIFIGYSKDDIDTIILRKFSAGRNFTGIPDTTLITNDNKWFYYLQRHDTTGVFPAYFRSNDYPTEGYDWEVFIPSQNRTIKISNIVVDQSRVPSKRPCPIVSYVQDGSVINYPPAASLDSFNAGAYRLYISK